MPCDFVGPRKLMWKNDPNLYIDMNWDGPVAPPSSASSNECLVSIYTEKDHCCHPRITDTTPRITDTIPGQVPKAAAKKNKGENNQENEGGNGEENKPLALEDAAPVEEKEETEGKEEKGNQETKKAKPKAMKKTKATPKQKAKAKPKAGTKKAGTKKAVPPVKKSGLKKSDKEKALKKPKQEEDKGAKAKGNKQTMKEKTAAWRQPLGIKKKEVEEGEEEDQKEADPEVSPDETRNYAKARKFAKMLKKGQLPEEIKLMYMQAAQNSESPRLFRTEMINRPFQKNKKMSGLWCQQALSSRVGSSPMAPGLQQPKVWGQQAWSCFGPFFMATKVPWKRLQGWVTYLNMKAFGTSTAKGWRQEEPRS